ncbi:hypothetical protein GRI97_08100 [Altererythrobacter xixiisoli]|uniref:Uncharacterized protein n=1 Tax=Croceibacterium xixiisoli TaxID=1476466 RepID=A0A6I4TWH2_9SPHN|nr:hypothetical protein [Croceibacterium xixiisoli]MXO98948.1 hypothetical protein [Croceibacterium xixiisoli]
MADATCPPLGTGSVDLHALHNAARDGADLAKALDDATERAPVPIVALIANATEEPVAFAVEEHEPITEQPPAQPAPAKAPRR